MRALRIEHVKRVEVELEPGERVEVPTLMRAFYIVAERLVIEYDDTAKGTTDLSTFLVEVHGERFRRLKDGVKSTGQTMMTFSRSQYPAELRQLIRDAWWLK